MISNLTYALQDGLVLRSCVSGEMGDLFKGQGTAHTLEGLFPSVGPFVGRLVGLLDEGLAAVGARVGPLTGVFAHVRGQMGLLAKVLLADFALELALGRQLLHGQVVSQVDVAGLGHDHCSTVLEKWWGSTRSSGREGKIIYTRCLMR